MAAHAARAMSHGVGGHQRDRLAPVAHVVLGQQGLVAGDARSREVAVDKQGHVGVGDHGVYAGHGSGRAGVEAGDPGVVVRGAQGGCVQHARYPHVVT